MFEEGARLQFYYGIFWKTPLNEMRLACRWHVFCCPSHSLFVHVVDTEPQPPLALKLWAAGVSELTLLACW